MKAKKVWNYGDRTKLAALADISPSYLCDIMSGRKECSPSKATRLATASKALGYDIPALVWAFPEMRDGNPLFPPYK